jgi:hypothetical protein
MDKINIGILHHSRFTKPKTGHIDIMSLVPKNKHDQYITNTSKKVVNSILRKKDDVRKRIIETYERILKNCVDKIMEKNKLKDTDLIFEIPNIIFNLPEYEPIECLDFIEAKLKEMYFDTKKIYPCNIFITWVNFEWNFNQKL